MAHQEDINAYPVHDSFNVADEKRQARVAELSENVTGEIRNPLVGVPRETLMRSAEKFAADHDLNDILPLLKKGALAAQNPADVITMDDFTDEEKEIFQEEITHKWRQPKIVYVTIILNSIAAAIQGWDQTGSNGANLSFPQAFGIPESGPICEAAGNCDSNQWLVGFINSCPYFAIFLFAGWIYP